MSTPTKAEITYERRISMKAMDVLIRAAFVFALTLLCYRIFSPFISLMAWALILAVTIYPAYLKLTRKLGRRHGLAATLVVLAGLTLIVAPTAVLLASTGDSVHEFLGHVRDNTLVVPEPSPAVAEWPIVGKKVYQAWSLVHTDLPAVIQKRQPQISELAARALEMVASIAGTVLLFMFSFVIAGIMMAYGEAGAIGIRNVLGRIAGMGRGDEFAALGTSTIRAVAMGVLGVAFIQALVVGILLIIAGVPFAGVLAIVTLVLGIAQVPAMLVTLPVIAYIWASGDYATTPAIIHTVLLILAGTLDNILKPLLLGRGVDAPMPVVLLGALGGLAGGGILGMFVGATALSLGYQILMLWVDTNPDNPVEAIEDPRSDI